ncbi:Calmodulin [Balamuthia mandrillaris]
MYTTGVRPGGVPPVSKRVFDKHDKDHSGSIDEKEFRSMCYDLGYHLSDLELKMAVKRLDMNGDGGISYEEFVHWWRTDDRFKILQLSEEEQESLASCAKYFRFFDKDDNGQLSREEFRAVHKNLVENNYTRKSFEELLADLDTDNDGHVSFNEYVQWLVRIGSLKVRHF